MKQEIDPKDTSRARAFELWMKAPNPMVTFFKTVDVTRLVKISRKKGYKFNMLLDWCIGKAASSIKEFYLLPVGGKLIQYDNLAVNTIVKNKEGEVSSCDILFNEEIEDFNRQYLEYTSKVAKSCKDWDLSGENSTTHRWTVLTPESFWPICKKRLIGYTVRITGLLKNGNRGIPYRLYAGAAHWRKDRKGIPLCTWVAWTKGRGIGLCRGGRAKRLSGYGYRPACRAQALGGSAFAE
jgi:hypothetical protein